MCANAATKAIFAFTSTIVENLHVLSDGNVLLNTLKSPGLLCTVDPRAAKPVARQVANLPSFHNITGLTGIVPLGDDLYAVSGGLINIIRIDTRTKDVSVAIEDEALHPGNGAALAVGIKGLKTRGDFIYFTNSALGTFSRVPIDELGNKAGNFEVLARALHRSIYVSTGGAFAGDPRTGGQVVQAWL
ncbi:hypothetical protein diail_9692 [Diaporthe ilicicola]|nr:hypothetical protein diail_9692 [Diaporthe ilicicola]